FIGLLAINIGLFPAPILLLYGYIHASRTPRNDEVRSTYLIQFQVCFCIWDMGVFASIAKRETSDFKISAADNFIIMSAGMRERSSEPYGEHKQYARLYRGDCLHHFMPCICYVWVVKIQTGSQRKGDITFPIEEVEIGANVIYVAQVRRSSRGQQERLVCSNKFQNEPDKTGTIKSLQETIKDGTAS
ncbi:hypothetical protein KI387_006026, partial [Taxus chinensis]